MSATQWPALAPTFTGLATVAVGGALGALARYAVTLRVERHAGRWLPWGTLAVNLSAALMAGILLAFFNRGGSTPSAWLFWMAGLLGSYSTVSSFSLQTLTLARSRQSWRSLLYLLLSVAGCLVLVMFGYGLGRWFAGAAHG